MGEGRPGAGRTTEQARGEAMKSTLWATLDRRFWAMAAAGCALTLLVLGIPTAVIPNPWFVRMTQTEPFNVAVWLASAVLAGPLIATYLARTPGTIKDPGEGRTRTSLAGIGAFLAIGCPICNKIVVAALGVSGALNIFAPIQPLLGAASVALLGATLAWRLRLRARRCEMCVSPAGERAAAPG